MKTCIICGKDFEPLNSLQLTCSAECKKEKNRRYAREYRRNNLAKKHKIRPCQMCGKLFEQKNSKQILCSEECRAKKKHFHNTKAKLIRDNFGHYETVIHCIVCGKPFSRNKNQKTCTKRCSRKNVKMKQHIRYVHEKMTGGVQL